MEIDLNCDWTKETWYYLNAIRKATPLELCGTKTFPHKKVSIGGDPIEWICFCCGKHGFEEEYRDGKIN